MNIFNNREIATAIWLFVIFVFMITKRDIRKSILGVFKSILKLKIHFLIFFMFVYTTAVIIILYQVGFWDISLLKDSIIWFFFSGIVMSVNSITSKKGENIFRKIIIDNFKVVMVIEFLVNFYTFSLIGELLLIPFVTVIFLLETVANTDKEYSSVVKLMKGLQVIIGILILVYTTSNVISNYKSCGSLITLRNFLFLPILTLSFLLFIYFILLYSKYDLLFVRLNMGCEKSKELKKYARKKIIKNCLLSLNKVKKVLDMNTNNLMHISNEEDVDEIVKNL